MNDEKMRPLRQRDRKKHNWADNTVAVKISTQNIR